ncbi:MAG: ATP-binding cassette domain-containing protein [Acidobacteriaceae bacterium]
MRLLEQVDSAAPLLSVEDLRIAFSGRTVVRGISFRIAPGQTLGLVGESGSGKSATALALLRLLPPSAVASGKILLASAARSVDATEVIGGTHEAANSEGAGGGCDDLLRLPEEAMRRHRGACIAMIFQEPMTALNPVMTVGEQIAEGLLAHAPRRTLFSGDGLSRREIRERVLQAMREVALPDPERRIDDYPHQFSGGQRQRIMIAMALINKPRLLIADEPTTALDVTVQAQILELLRKLKREHQLAMLFISHDLAVVAQIADRVAVMRHGEIVEQGEVQQVLTRAQHPYTRKLLASAPTMSTARDQPLATLVGAGSGQGISSSCGLFEDGL